MICPKCKTESRIERGSFVFNKETETLNRKLVFVCRNKDCDKYGQEVGEEVSAEEVTVEQEKSFFIFQGMGMRMVIKNIRDIFYEILNLMRLIVQL